MERRKILLGSGAALTTALAGCTGSDSSDDDEPDDDTESITDGETDTDDSETDENGENDDTEPDENTDPTGSDDDIPGFDASNLSLESDEMTIRSVERAGDTVEVVATSEITDYEALYAELESLADDHEQAVTDLEAFGDAIETVEWVVDHDDMKVVSFTVEVAWLVDYREGDLSREEFRSKVEATAE